MIHETALISLYSTVDPSASIGPNVVVQNAIIGPNVTIMAGAYVGRPPMAVGVVSNQPSADGPAKIGENSIIGVNAVIYAGTELAGNNLIGDGTTIRENTKVGKETVIGSNCTVQNGATIGDRVKIVDLSHITFDCEIGDDSFISVGVYTMNDNSMARGGEVVGPKIGKRVRIGGGAMLLPGVKIGDDALVGAGSVVTHDVPAGSRVMGVPAKSKAEQVTPKGPGTEGFLEFSGWPPRPYQEWPPVE